MTIPHQDILTAMESKIGIQNNIEEVKRNVVFQWFAQHWRALLSEMVATGFLVFFGCMTFCIMPGGVETPVLYIPVGFGLVILMNVQIFGHISGAHMNPALSLAAVIWGSMSVILGIFYAIMQCVGAILGFGLLLALAAKSQIPEAMCSNHPSSELTKSQVVGLEIVFTLALAFVCCSIWDPKNAKLHDSVSIKFGLIITALCIASGHFHGASMNPARTIGPAVWNGTWSDHWVYWVGPLIGGALAAIIYKYIWKSKSEYEHK